MTTRVQTTLADLLRANMWKLPDKEPKPARVGHRTVVLVAIATAAWLGYNGRQLAVLSDKWDVQLAIFVGVITIPYWFIDRIGLFAESVGPERVDPTKQYERRLSNLGALVGMAERPLLLAAIIAGFPQFIAVWYVLKGIAGFATEGNDEKIRTFQLYLLNSALSLAAVALAWFTWHAFGLPTTNHVSGD